MIWLKFLWLQLVWMDLDVVTNMLDDLPFWPAFSKHLWNCFVGFNNDYQIQIHMPKSLLKSTLEFDFSHKEMVFAYENNTSSLEFNKANFRNFISKCSLITT